MMYLNSRLAKFSDIQYTKLLLEKNSKSSWYIVINNEIYTFIFEYEYIYVKKFLKNKNMNQTLNLSST